MDDSNASNSLESDDDMHFSSLDPFDFRSFDHEDSKAYSLHQQSGDEMNFSSLTPSKFRSLDDPKNHSSLQSGMDDVYHDLARSIQSATRSG